MGAKCERIVAIKVLSAQLTFVLRKRSRKVNLIGLGKVFWYWLIIQSLRRLQSARRIFLSMFNWLIKFPNTRWRFSPFSIIFSPTLEFALYLFSLHHLNKNRFVKKDASIWRYSSSIIELLNFVKCEEMKEKNGKNNVSRRRC